ncbi:ester cyclase [Flavobacterium aquidurense]|uniref:ester cyclase n=1 Tax=Flavobacterium TaxID=237 RepID=UPI0037583F7F
MNKYKDIYVEYIECLNRHKVENLGIFIHEDVYYNNQHIGLSRYQKMLEKNFIDIPDLYFNVQLLTCDDLYVASKLSFAYTPKENFSWS